MIKFVHAEAGCPELANAGRGSTSNLATWFVVKKEVGALCSGQKSSSFGRLVMERLMGRLTCSQVIATVLTLGWATCPMVFAVERGRQEGKHVAREVVSRVVGTERADSLLAQIEGMQIGRFVTIGNTASSTVSFELSGATYVFTRIASDVNGRLSSFVEQYDLNGTKTGEFDFTNIAATDDNRLEFSVVASMQAASSTVDGALVGVPSDPGTAVATTSVDGGASRLSLVNFSGVAPAVSAAASASTLSLPIVTPFPTQAGQGGVALFLIDDIVAAVTFVMLLVIGVAVVFFVGFTCFAFGWWGCDGFWL